MYLCACCNNPLDDQGVLKNTGRFAPPKYLICCKQGCKSFSLKKMSKEWKVYALGMTMEEIDASYARRLAKSVSTKRANGYYDDPTNNPYGKDFWLKRGLSAEEALQKMQNKAKRAVDTKRENGFYDEPANNPYSIAYWEKAGYSHEEAKLKIRQKNHNCEEYWIERGASIEDAEGLAIKSAGVTGLSSFQRRYGDVLGLERYNTFCKMSSENWTFKSAGGSHFGTSRQAMKFFIRLYRRVRRLGYARKDMKFKPSTPEYLISVKGSHSLTGKRATVFYDFLLWPLNLLIEFNGEHVHPSPSLNEIQYNNWRHAYSKITADEANKNDLYKKMLAEDRGFTLLYVWSKQSMEAQLCSIVKLIKELKNEHLKLQNL